MFFFPSSTRISLGFIAKITDDNQCMTGKKPTDIENCSRMSEKSNISKQFYFE